MDTLNLHPSLSILEEPFHEKFVEWNPEKRNYHKLVKDHQTLDEQLEHIYREYDGIKVLAYQKSEDIFDYMLSKRDYKIIFLRRRNLLQTVVSTLIAKQTNLWERNRLQGSIEELYANLEPFDMENIAEYLRGLKWIQEHYERVIDARAAKSYKKWTYEEFYFVTEEQRYANLKAIYDFLEVEPYFSEQVRKKLDPKNAKINGQLTYALIPNRAEIEERFGSDETGWLHEGA